MDITIEEGLKTAADGIKNAKVASGINPENKPDSGKENGQANPVPPKEEKKQEQEKVNKEEEEKVDDPKNEDAENEDEPSDENEDQDGDEVEELSIQHLQEHLGVNYEGEEFEESVDGIARLVNRVSEDKAKTAFDSFIKSIPGLESYVSYIQNGGDINKYISLAHPDIKYDDLNTKDKNDQDYLIRQHLKNSGIEGKDIDETIKLYETSGIKEKQAEIAKKVLSTKQKAELEQEQNRQAQEAKANKEKSEAHWNSVEKTLQSNNSFLGINIKEADKKELFKYVAYANEGENMTMFYSDLNKALSNPEQMLALAILMQKGLKLDDIVSKKAASENAKKKKIMFSKAAKGSNIRSADAETKSKDKDPVHRFFTGANNLK